MQICKHIYIPSSLFLIVVLCVGCYTVVLLKAKLEGPCILFFVVVNVVADTYVASCYHAPHTIIIEKLFPASSCIYASILLCVCTPSALCNVGYACAAEPMVDVQLV